MPLVEATSVNYDRYAMPCAVVDVVDGRSNVHAINDFVGLNYAGRRCWGLRFRQMSGAYQGCKENGLFHFLFLSMTAWNPTNTIFIAF
jgi:hypothetical protein